MECSSVQNKGKHFIILIQNFIKSVFARKFTSNEIYKMRLLYYVSCSFFSTTAYYHSSKYLISYPLVVYHIVCRYDFIHSTAAFYI